MSRFAKVVIPVILTVCLALGSLAALGSGASPQQAVPGAAPEQTKGLLDGPGYVRARDYGPPSQASLKAALGAIGVLERTLVITPGTWALNTDLTIPANVTLRLERGALLSDGGGAANLTVLGGLQAGPDQQIFSWTGAGKVRFGGNFPAELWTEWWGAKADGSTKCSAAIQAAIDARGAVGSGIEPRSRRIMFAAGDYNLDTCLNLTSTRAAGTIQRDGVWLCGSAYYAGTRFLGQTGNLVIDTCGSSFIKITDIQIFTAASYSNPSKVGILCAPNKALPACQFHYYQNVTITMHDEAAANGGYGTVALCNFGAEEHTYNTIWLQANTPAILTGSKVMIPAIDSVYQAGNLPTYNSLGVTSFIGESVFKTVNRRQAALNIADVNTLNITNAYIANSGTGGSNDTAIRVNGILSTFKFCGNVEVLGTFLQLPGTIRNAEVRCNLANTLNAAAPVINLEPAGSAGIIAESDLSFHLHDALTRKLLAVVGPPAGNARVSSFLANTTIKTNQTRASGGLDRNLLFNAHTRNFQVQMADYDFRVGDHSQEISIPPTAVGTVGGSSGAAVCKVAMPAPVPNSAAGSFSLVLAGALHTGKNYGTNAGCTKTFQASQNIATHHSDGAITISDADGRAAGNQADIFASSTPAAVNPQGVRITGVKVEATATGVTTVTFKVVPALAGTATGEPIYFTGQAKITWGNFYAQAPWLSLP